LAWPGLACAARTPGQRLQVRHQPRPGLRRGLRHHQPVCPRGIPGPSRLPRLWLPVDRML